MRQAYEILTLPIHKDLQDKQAHSMCCDWEALRRLGSIGDDRVTTNVLSISSIQS